MKMLDPQDFGAIALAEAQLFLASQSSMSGTKLGERAIGDSALMVRLKQGRGCTWYTLYRVRLVIQCWPFRAPPHDPDRRK